MQSNLFNSKILIFSSLVLFLTINCNRKTSAENQITIKINSIDSQSKRLRVNTFDTIEVRVEGFGYLKKTFKKIGEYTTDSTGSVKIKIDSTEGFIFMLRRKGFYGSAEFAEAFTKEKLKDGQVVNLEVLSLEDR